MFPTRGGGGGGKRVQSTQVSQVSASKVLAVRKTIREGEGVVTPLAENVGEPRTRSGRVIARCLLCWPAKAAWLCSVRALKLSQTIFASFVIWGYKLMGCHGHTRQALTWSSCFDSLAGIGLAAILACQRSDCGNDVCGKCKCRRWGTCEG